jgi:hypothetical protein
MTRMMKYSLETESLAYVRQLRARGKPAGTRLT